MLGSSAPSFIPKQNPVKAKRVAVSRQVYLFTAVSYVVMAATLLASAALFFYGRYTSQVLANETEALSGAIAEFDTARLAEVVAFDERLSQVDELLRTGISVRSILAALETATIDTVQIKDFQLSRRDESVVSLQLNLVTDSFDSVLFQRELYNVAPAFTSVSVENVAVTLAGELGNARQDVSLAIVFTVDRAAAGYQYQSMPVAPSSPVSPMPTVTSNDEVVNTAPAPAAPSN